MRQRLERHLLAQLVTFGDHSISALLSTAGRQALDWSADYRMYSRCRIRPQQLFDSVRTDLLAQLPDDEPLVVSIDDTRVRKTGRKVAGAHYTRDPMGPRFQVNFIWAQRFVQASLAAGSGADTRLVPIGWQHAPTVKKPSPQAGDAERQACRSRSLGRVASTQLHQMRAWFDQHEARERTLWCVVDGGYTNSTVLQHLPANTHLIGRIRSDAKLHNLPQATSGQGPSGSTATRPRPRSNCAKTKAFPGKRCRFGSARSSTCQDARAAALASGRRRTRSQARGDCAVALSHHAAR